MCRTTGHALSLLSLCVPCLPAKAVLLATLQAVDILYATVRAVALGSLPNKHLFPKPFLGPSSHKEQASRKCPRQLPQCDASIAQVSGRWTEALEGKVEWQLLQQLEKELEGENIWPARMLSKGFAPHEG